MVAIPVKKAINIPDGWHVGVITNIRYRSRPFDYVDLEIEFPVEEQTVRIKAGYPQLITENSKLGQLLGRFGEKLIEGVSIDPDQVLIGKKVKFKTVTQTNNKGTFSNIDPETVKPTESLNDYPDTM